MKILIISPSWIGDIVMSHSLYRILFLKYQSHITIDVVAPKNHQAVINYMPEVHKILTAPYTHRVLNFKKYYNFANFLQINQYHQAIVLPNSLKSALIPFLAKIPIRTGWKGEMRYGLINDLRILKKSHLPLMVQRYAALAYDPHVIQHFSDLPNPFPLPELNINSQETQKTLFKFNLHKHIENLIGLCPGSASGLFKNWPYYHYITLTTELIFNGYHVVILGSNQDQLTKQLIKIHLSKNLKKYYHNLIGHTSLNEVIAILASCKAIISNDSGLMHTACSLKRPVIGLFGPTNPKFTPPLFYKSKIIYNDNQHQNITFKPDLYGYHYNLINITPNRVLKTLKTLLF